MKQVRNLQEINCWNLPSEVSPLYTTVRLSEGYELNLFSKADESLGFLKSASDDLISFTSKGKVAVFSADFLENSQSKAHQIEMNNKRLELFIQFIHKYQSSLMAFNQKASKRRMNKKEQEKMNQARETMITEIIDEFKLRLANLSQGGSTTNHQDSMSHERLMYDFLRDWDQGVPMLPGVFSFDLFSQQMSAYDNFGRLITGNAVRGLDYSPIDYDSAIKLLEIDTTDLGSASDLKSLKSSTVEPMNPTDLRLLFKQFLSFLNSQEIDAKVMSLKGELCRHFYSNDDFRKIKATNETKKGYSCDKRNFESDFVAHDLLFMVKSMYKQKQEMTQPISLPNKIDVLKVNSIEYPNEPERWVLKTIIQSKRSLDKAYFQEQSTAQKAWMANFIAANRLIGNLDHQSLPIETKIFNKSIRTTYFLKLEHHLSSLSYSRVVSSFEMPSRKMKTQASIKETIQATRIINPLVFNTSTTEINHNTQTSAIKYQSNHSAKTRSKATLMFTRSSAKDLIPKFVANYFDTLNGKEYLIDNPIPVQPAILTHNDKVLIAELLEKAKVEEQEFRSEIQKNTALMSGSRVNFKNDQASDKRASTFQSQTRPLETHVPSINGIIEKEKKSQNSIKPSLDTVHIFSKISGTDAAEQRAQQFQLKKNKNYNIYGEPREKLPPVKSLYKQPSPVVLPEVNTNGISKPDSKDLRSGSISSSMVAQSRIDNRMDKKPSSIHQVRNFASHKLLLMSLDKGFKGMSGMISQKENQKMTQNSINSDLIIFPDVVDFGNIQEDSVYETKFTIVNSGKSLQRVVIKPPLYCPNISVVKEEGPFAPGLAKPVRVLMDTRSFKKGQFAHEIRIASEITTYKLRVCGVVIEKNSQQLSEEEREKENLVFTHLKESTKPAVQYPVSEVKDPSLLLSTAGQHEGQPSQLPRIFYDPNYKVR